ncbi:MAG: hypothetical protein C0621_07955 [Desulfuromonas sp.]|nr:MAG: hypothetical protein C0621_07955 [Desulfuromonas sp.]
MNVVLYDRFAIDNPHDHARIAADRVNQMRSWCREHGHTIYAEYIEQGNKHVSDDRPAFEALKKAVTTDGHSIQGVVFQSFNRLFRDPIKLAMFERGLLLHGVKLISMAADSTVEPSHMIKSLVGLFDKFQSKEHAKHTLRAMQEKARQGYFTGGVVPFGYMTITAFRTKFDESKLLDVHPLEAETVKLIFDLHIRGIDGTPFTTKQIADHLNIAGCLRRKRPWTPASIRSVLRDETYLGERIFNRRCRKTGQLKPEGEWIRVTVPAIIPEHVFTSAQRGVLS